MDSPDVATHTSIVQLFQASGDQRCIIIGRVVFLFPGIMSFQSIELGCGGSPFVVRLGLRVLVSM
jgi:hypothetical protein